MNIVIPVIGSRGDIQPFIGLAQGLSSAGYAVSITSHPGMRNLVETHGVRFQPMGPDIDMSLEAGAIRDRTANPMLGLIRVMQYAFQVIEKSHSDLLDIYQNASLVVIHGQSAVGLLATSCRSTPTTSGRMISANSVVSLIKGLKSTRNGMSFSSFRTSLHRLAAGEE